MRSFTTLSLITIGSLTALLSACDNGGGGDASGGTGATAAGGTTATGGLTSTGGTATTGGASSTGGATAVGGTTSTGGADSGCTPGTKDEAYATAEEAGVTVGVGVYDYGDDCGSSVSMTAMDGEVCTTGTAAQVVMDMWDTIWGAGIGVTFAETGSADLSTYTGFKFTITGAPTGLRVGVMMDGDTNSFFTTDIVEGENTLFFDELANGDWVTPAGVLDTTKIKDIQWQVPSTSTAAADFDFCVSDISLHMEAGMGGAPATP